MATAKKAAKKPAKKAAVKKEVVKFTPDQVVLTKTEQKQVDLVLKNEEKIEGQKRSMVEVAIDSGNRLNTLKTAITKKFPGTWKGWAELNLSISYPQVTRYMKVAKGQALLEGKSYSSLEDAVKLISYDGDEEAMEASGTSKEAKRKAATTQKAVAFSPAAMMSAIDAITDLESLTDLRDYIQARMDEMVANGFDEGSDEVEASDEVEEAEETQSDINDLING